MQITINIKTIDEALKKPRAESTVVIDMMKRLGIRGDKALEYYQIFGPDYLVRKILYTEYMKPRDKRRYFAAMMREEYPETDGFHEWAKRRKSQILMDDKIPQEIKQIIGRAL